MSERKKRNIIIGCLCGVLLLMVVGYAAFSSVLKINGTSNISSNWDIQITNITSKVLKGTPSNAIEPTGVGTLTATFETNLVSPGDSMEYVITVTNNGSINAQLDKITVSEPDNEAISFETSGLTVGSTLASKGTADLKVTVTYKESVTEQPKNTKSKLTVTLNYVQEGTSSSTPVVPDNQLTTVYVYHTDTKTIGTSILTESEYKANYTELDSYISGRKSFLKYDIDSKGVIQNAYACLKYTFIDEPVCLQGYQDSEGNSYFNANKTLLASLEPVFNANSGSCSLDSDNLRCKIGNLYVDEFSNGDIHASNYAFNDRCHIYANGTTACDE